MRHVEPFHNIIKAMRMGSQVIAMNLKLLINRLNYKIILLIYLPLFSVKFTLVDFSTKWRAYLCVYTFGLLRN
jgi:hypothetical protein